MPTVAAAIAPRAQVRVYPNALPPTPLPPGADEEAMVFSGNMEYHPNVRGAFLPPGGLAAAARALARAGVAPGGKEPGAVPRFTAGDPRIEVPGAVEDAVASWRARRWRWFRCWRAAAPG